MAKKLKQVKSRSATKSVTPRESNATSPPSKASSDPTQRLNVLGGLDGGTAAPFKVNGHVRSTSGAPVAGVTVRAFDRDLRTEQGLGEVTTDEQGRYEISYTFDKFARPEKGSADLIVRVLDGQGETLDESLGIRSGSI